MPPLPTIYVLSTLMKQAVILIVLELTGWVCLTRCLLGILCAITPAFARPGFATAVDDEWDRCAQVFGPSTI